MHVSVSPAIIYIDLSQSGTGHDLTSLDVTIYDNTSDVNNHNPPSGVTSRDVASHEVTYQNFSTHNATSYDFGTRDTNLDDNAMQLVDLIMKSKVGEGVLTHLKKFLAESAKDRIGRRNFYKILGDLIGPEIYDYNVFRWVCTKIGLPIDGHRGNRSFRWLNKWKNKNFLESRGRPKLNASVKNQIYHEWISTSIMTVDRRYGKEYSTISQKKYADMYTPHDIEFLQGIEPFINKRGTNMYRHPRLITTLSTRKMKKNMEKKLGMKLSIGNISACKPFFCGIPSEREMCLCLCKVCLNIRKLFDSIMSCLRKQSSEIVPHSISQFFMEGCECRSLNGYYPLECVRGNCTNMDQLSSNLSISNPNEELTYYNFEVMKKKYKAKKGESKGLTKTSTVTERVTYRETVGNAMKKMMQMKPDYLMHR